MHAPLKGRLIGIEKPFYRIQNEHGCSEIQADPIEPIHLGDIVEAIRGQIRVLTPNRGPHPQTSWIQKTLHPRRLQCLEMRSRVETGIREFFLSQSFREVRTPLLVPCPGMEPHIRPFQIQPTPSSKIPIFLPTSPEFAMKRLLVGGLEKIFQIAPAFRDEPLSRTHLPEFTLLEWYRAYSQYEKIMEDTENLFYFLTMRFFGKPFLPFQGKEISILPPWPRLKIRDLFLDLAGIDLIKKSTVELLSNECHRFKIPTSPKETWDDLYFKIWLNIIEPQLPQDQALFVTRYPPSQAALSVIDSDPDGSLWARRFEIYACGIELGNAFEELTDPIEQRRRFEEDMQLRSQIYGPSFANTPLDEEFLEALTEGMPPSSGIAIGVDRMVMLFANEKDISFTVWLPPDSEGSRMGNLLFR